LIDKKMKLGLHTYTLHLWGLGQNWGVVADPRPKEMNLLQLMDKAVEWGLDGLHITGCDLETKDDTRLLEVKQAAASRNLYLEYNFSTGRGVRPASHRQGRRRHRIAEKLGADLDQAQPGHPPAPSTIRQLLPSGGHEAVMRLYDEVCCAAPAGAHRHQTGPGKPYRDVCR
jgi:sugar phosphate isomerase/epimerase